MIKINISEPTLYFRMNADVGGGGLIKRLDNGNHQRKLNIGADNFKFFRSCADLST